MLRTMEPPEPAVEAVPQMPMLRLVRPSRGARRLARVLTLLLIATPFALLFVPWRQSVSGSGQVIGFAPMDRQQPIGAPIKGRVAEWHVIEGTHVRKGDPVALLSDLDPLYTERLQTQLEATEDKLQTTEAKVRAYEEVRGRLETARDMAVEAATNNVEIAQQKVEAQQQEVDAAKASLAASTLNYNRQKQMYTEGLASRRDYELAEQKYREDRAKVQKAEADLAGTKNDVLAKKAYLEEVKAKSQGEIDKIGAMLQEARGEMALARKDLQDIQVKLARQQSREVLAPRDGTILRLLVNTNAEVIKEGEPIALFVPDAAQLAAEIWIDGNDAPLVRKGRHVRLQFEGWPAVQFAGWPSVAIGSFGGTVALVDTTDIMGKGQFRILVVPDGRQAWPEPPWLRQGVRTKGWVLLNQVSLGYEIWRRLNGFPPVISKDGPGDGPTKEKDKDKKKVKLPK